MMTMHLSGARHHCKTPQRADGSTADSGLLSAAGTVPFEEGLKVESRPLRPAWQTHSQVRCDTNSLQNARAKAGDGAWHPTQPVAVGIVGAGTMGGITMCFAQAGFRYPGRSGSRGHHSGLGTIHKNYDISVSAAPVIRSVPVTSPTSSDH